MLSKNNYKLSNQKLSAKKQRFKIKKLSVGVASVLVGTLFATYTGAEQASADTQVEPAVATETDESTSETKTFKVVEGADNVAETTPETSAPVEAPAETSETVAEAPEAEATAAPAEESAVADVEVSETPEKATTEEADAKTPVVEEKTEEVKAPAVAETKVAQSSGFRAAKADEAKVYSLSGQQPYVDSTGKMSTGKVTSMDGYVNKKKHTSNREEVRVEVKFVPSAPKSSKALPISVELTGNANYTIPDNIKINGKTVRLTGDGYFYASGVTVEPNAENLIEFTITVTGRLNKVTAFNVWITTARQGYARPFEAKASDANKAFRTNSLVATNTFDPKAYSNVIQELEAPADKVEQVEVPYETVYKADPELLGGQRQVEKKGVSGQKTVITTHVLGANNQFVAKTSEEITKQPEAEIVRVGTKAETTTEAIPFTTVYEEDPNMKVTDKEVIAVAGVAGQKVTTKSYTLNEQTGELTTQETVKVTDPVNQVIKHGPSGEINYQTEYRENKNLTAGETKVIQAGKKGASTKVYDSLNGTATATFSPKTEASVTREPQLIVVLVEKSGVVGKDMYLSTDVSKLAPLWDKMEDGDKLLWISALRIPEKFDDAKASYSVKGQDAAIKPLESIGTITADQIPARFNISDEDLKNAEIRLETDLFTENENSLVNNKALVNLLNKAGSRVISIRNTGRNKQEFKKNGFAEKAFQKAKMPYKLDDQAGLFSVTPNLVPTIVYKPLTIAIADPSGELQITSAQLKVGSEVKDLKVAAGKVQDEYTPKDDTPIEVSYAFAGKATQTRAIEFNVTADGTSVAKLSTNVQPKAHFEATTPTNEVIEVGTKPTSTSEEIPFETTYVTDEKMRADDPEVVLVEGKVGQKVTTINYTLDLNTGKVTAQAPQTVITAQPITRQIKRGVGKETSIPYTTTYQASEKLDLNKQEIKVKGKNGVLQPNGVVTRAAVTEIILVGTKPTVEEKTLDFTTLYTADPMSLPTDPEVIEQVGKAGKQVTTTKYKVDRKTGAVTALEPTVETTPAVDQIVKRGTGKTTVVAKPTKYVANVELANKTTREVVAGVDGIIHPNGKVLTEVVARVVEVGTKPVVVETAIEPQVIYQNDPTMKKDDPEVVVVAGTAGKTIETTTFTVDEQTGEVSSDTAVETIKAIDRVIKRGSGEENQIPYQTRYEADETMVNGTTAVKVAGQLGIKHPNGTTTKEPVTELILVGTKPVVVETAIEPQVIYQDDPTMKKDDPEVIMVAGTAGKTIETTTFAVNEQTGELSSSVATETIAATDRVIKRGSGEETQIPYQTRYEADATKQNGTKAVKVAGQVGTKHPNGTTTKEPVTELILVGTKPVVVETTIEPQVIYQDDPTMKKDDPEVIVVAGTAGKTIETTTFAVNEQTGELSSSVATETLKAIDRVIKRGSGEETQIPYQTRYEADATKQNGTTAVKVAGQVGIKHPNGTTTKEPVTELILVGTKPVVVETAIEPQVIYQDDPTMKKDDPEVIVVPGTAGKTIETTTFAVNEQTGELSSSVATETLKAIDRVIKRGSGEETQIPYQTRYKGDESLAKGERVVAIPGQVGIKHPNGTVTKEPVTEIILVGTKPEVVVEELDFTILCEADPTLPVGTTVIVQAGEKGQKIKTITYRVDEETGELIAEETEEVIAPVTQLVKQGTKVEEPQPEVKPVAKVETPKAQPKVELPQTGDVNENNLALLGLLGLTGAGLLVVGRRKRQTK